MDFALELPINNLSFGQVSINLLLEIHKRGLNPCIFPIGNPDISAFNKLPEDFKFWLKQNIEKAYSTYSRNVPIIKLWHLNGSLGSLGKEQVLFTFHELDEATPNEINVVRNNHRVVFSSKYSASVFAPFANNVGSVKLGFDAVNFRKTGRKYLPDGVVGFTLAGKLEKRKHHAKILSLWARLFGNDKRYMLNCALFNQFMKVEEQEAILGNALGGKKPFNINFVPFMQSNEAYNDFLNCGHIDLTGLSGAEGWNLPAFQQTCLGKWSIVLDAHAHKDWATKDNAILVAPKDKEESYDGVFFAKGMPFNQGSIFTWDEAEVEAAMKKAIESFAGKPNTEGEKLAAERTWAKTVDVLLFNVSGA